MALTERLALIVDAHSGGAVREFRKAADEADKLGKAAAKTGGLLDKTAASFGLSSASLKAGVAAGAGAAVVALGRFGLAAADAASAVNEAANAARITFGPAAASVEQFAERAVDAFGLSERAALQASNTFGAIFKNVGVGANEAAVFSEALVGLSSDVASFQNVAGGAEEVLDKFRSGLTGESEPLKQLKIFINEATVEAKAFEIGLGGANRKLTEGEKVMARFALILDQSGSAMGDFARTSSSLANQQRILAANTENLKASLGGNAAPALAGFTGGLNDIIGASRSLSSELPILERIAQAQGKALSGAAAGPLAAFVQFVRGLKTESAPAATAAEKLQLAILNFSEESQKGTRSAQALAAAKRQVSSAASAFTAEQNRLNDALETEEEKAAKAAAAERNLQSSLVNRANVARAVEASQRAVSDAEANLAARQRELNELMRRGAVDAEDVASAQRALTASTNTLTEARDRLARAQRAVAVAERRGPLDAQEAALDLADAQDRVRVAGERLDSLRADSETRAEDVAAAERDLQRAAIDLAQLHIEQETATSDLTVARQELTAAEQALKGAEDEVKKSQQELRDAQAGDPEFAEKLAEKRRDLATASQAVSDAQYNAAVQAINMKTAAEELSKAVDGDAQAVGRLREQLHQLQLENPALARLLSGVLSVPNAGGGTLTSGPGPARSANAAEFGASSSTGGSGVTIFVNGVSGEDVVAALQQYERRYGSTWRKGW